MYSPVGRIVPGFLLCGIAFLVSTGNSNAQNALPSEQSRKASHTTFGPATVPLAEMAELNVPPAYHFVDAEGTRVLLQSGNNPIPKMLLGSVVRDSGGWFAIIQFADIGYIKDPQKEHLDPVSILETYRRTIDRQNNGLVGATGPTVVDLDWQLRPSFDPGANKLEYAVKGGVNGQSSVNHCISLLGRHGVIAITGVYPFSQDLDLATLGEIARGISFKPGERYADRQSSDRVAKAGLAQLVAEDKGDSVWQVALDQAKSKGVWAGMGLALVFAGWRLTSLGVRTRKRRIIRSNGNTRPAPRPAIANGNHTANGNGNGNGRPLAASPAPGKVQVSIPIEERKHSSSKSASRKRRRQFSYHAFYSDMVMSLTRCNYDGGYSAIAAEQNDEPRMVVSDNNGHGDTLPLNLNQGVQNTRATPAESLPPDAAKLLVTETAKLLESQQKLIEGQRKLIEEQTRLIQEKCKLLDAESRALEKQSELFTEHDLL